MSGRQSDENGRHDNPLLADNRLLLNDINEKVLPEHSHREAPTDNQPARRGTGDGRERSKRPTAVDTEAGYANGKQTSVLAKPSEHARNSRRNHTHAEAKTSASRSQPQ